MRIVKKEIMKSLTNIDNHQ